MNPIARGDLHVPTDIAPIGIDTLTEAWRQAHFAAQAAAEVGKSWATVQADDSHSSLGWVRTGTWRGLEGVPAVGDRPLRARLRFDGLTLSLADADGGTVDTLGLPGRTLDDALAWIGAVAERELGPRRQPAEPAPDLPDHPIGDGGAFKARPALATLAELYDFTARLLDRLRAVAPAFDEPRCWPHHFDLAALAVVATDEGGAMTRTIGIGITPPDSVEASGYWYVSPWARDDLTRATCAPLSAGHWLDRGGGAKMAVLPVAAVLSAEEPGRLVAEFVAESIVAASEALGV